jgi:hypothetical protein
MKWQNFCATRIDQKLSEFIEISNGSDSVSFKSALDFISGYRLLSIIIGQIRGALLFLTNFNPLALVD